VDRTNEFAGGNIENSRAMPIMVVPNEQTAKCFGREFFLVAVLPAEVGHASENLDVREVSGDAMHDCVSYTPESPDAAGVRGKPVAEVDSRAHGEAPVLGGGTWIRV
jgi:hypothetical protein